MLAGEIDAVSDACLELLYDPPEHASDLASLKAACELVIREGFSIRNTYSREARLSALIVAIAFLPISKIDRLRPPPPVVHDDVAVEILSCRTRAFRDAWVSSAIQRSARPARVVHRLVTGGLATQPDSDILVLAFMYNPWAFDLSEPEPCPRSKSEADVVRDNPGQLDNLLWRLFEVEGRADDRRQVSARFVYGWPQAFAELVDDQTLDRERVMQAAFTALSRGFSAYHSVGFIELHDELALSLDEQEHHLGDYLRLCASHTGTIVKFALQSLRGLQLERALDTDQVLADIGPALLTPAKSTASLAIKVLVACVEGNPDRHLAGAQALLPALNHPKADIQLEAVRRLQAWFAVPPQELASQLEPLVHQCNATARAVLKPWLSSGCTSPSITTPTTFRPTTPDKTEFSDIQWLRDDRVLPLPLDDHALLELASATLEQPRDADQIDALVAALARCDRQALRNQTNAATLAKRAMVLLERDPPQGQHFVASCLVASFMPTDFVRLALPDWSTRHLAELTNGEVPFDYLAFHRFVELTERLCSNDSFVPLASPTHLGGLIDPVVFAERVIKSSSINNPNERHCALLRLAPSQNRLDEALAILEQSASTPAEVTAWVKGWFEYCRELESHAVAWHEHVSVNQYGYRFIGMDVTRSAIINPLGTQHAPALAEPWMMSSADHAGISLCTSLAPGLPALIAEFGIRSTGSTVGPARYQYDTVGVLDPYFDDAAPLGDAAHLLLALNLNKPTPIARATAIDLAIAASQDNRLDPVLLGKHIGALSRTAVVIPSRYGAVLEEIAGAIDHPYAIVEVLESAVATVVATTDAADPATRPRQMLNMLEVFESLVVELGCDLSPAALVALTSLSKASKTSKTAKAARRILLLVKAST